MKAMPLEHPTPLLQAQGLTKRYGRRRALTDCTLAVPPGRVVALVGPCGSGKSTLLQLCCGMVTPTSGWIRVLGEGPADDAAYLARVGYVPREPAVYGSFTVADHLQLGARLNPNWDRRLTDRRIASAGIPRDLRAARLSVGQRAELALTLAAGKRPELLVLDDPGAALDPPARAAFLSSVLQSVGEVDASVLLSGRLSGELERICDHLIVLSDSRVLVAGDVLDLLAHHHRVIAARGDLEHLPPGVEPIWLEDFGGYSGGVVRSERELPRRAWTVEPVELEELVLSYLSRASGATTPAGCPTVPVQPGS
jgi:ABC-2 type transport system ATP-binding protein